MPKKGIDYSKAVVYKIVCKNLDIKDCYVGSTTNIVKRRGQHKEACNNPNSKKHNRRVYTFIRENDGWNNWSVIEIEKYEAKDGEDLRKRERYWIERLKATLNSHRAILYRQEFLEISRERDRKRYEKEKEHRAEYAKNYYKKNKEKIDSIRKEELQCECGAIIKRSNMTEHKKSKKHQEYESTLEPELIFVDE